MNAAFGLGFAALVGPAPGAARRRRGGFAEDDPATRGRASRPARSFGALVMADLGRGLQLLGLPAAGRRGR